MEANTCRSRPNIHKASLDTATRDIRSSIAGNGGTSCYSGNSTGDSRNIPLLFAIKYYLCIRFHRNCFQTTRSSCNIKFFIGEGPYSKVYGTRMQGGYPLLNRPLKHFNKSHVCTHVMLNCCKFGNTRMEEIFQFSEMTLHLSSGLQYIQRRTQPDDKSASGTV